MPNYQKRIVYLSEEQLSQLYANGSITVGGTTITYSDNDMYVTPQSEPIYPVSNATNGNFVSLTSSGNISDSGHKHSDYVTVSQKGASNGVAELDNEGKIITSQLPGSVDEIKECDSRSAFPQQGEADKIYVAKDTNLAYRWSGTDYVEISPSLALGETSSTAYRGDRGKTAYDHASAKGSAFESGLYKITTNAEGHVTNVVAVTKSDITELGIPGSQPDVSGFYTKPAGGIPASDLADGVIPTLTDLIDDTAGNGTTDKVWSADKSYDELDLKAPKANPVFTGSVSEGEETIASGANSHSEGYMTTASGDGAHSEGSGTRATGLYSHAEGGGCQATGYGSHAEGAGTMAFGSNSHSEGAGTIASGNYSHTEGAGNTASGDYSHAENGGTKAYGQCSHAEGQGTIAAGSFSHVSGQFNVPDNYDNWTEWTVGTYVVGDKVKRTSIVDEETVVEGYICKIANSDAEWTPSHWENQDDKMNFAEIVGNGTNNSSGQSNARALDWDGNAFFKGDVYVGCNADSSGGTKLAKDVQIDGTSILNNGIANIPVATSSNLGAVKVDSTLGILLSNKKLTISKASDAYIKSGASLYKPIVPANQHTSVFYALAKLAGAEMDNSSNPVGIYTDAALQAIQKLFGLDGILGDYESATASKAYTIGETFIHNGKRYRATAAIAISDVIAPGTNCELDPLDGRYVKDTDYATSQRLGLVKVNVGYGITLDSIDRGMSIIKATASDIKAGTHLYKPIVPSNQHTSVFYALAKLAGVDLASGSDMIGVYPQTAKTAIQTMLGIEADIPLVETVTGATASITGMPNVRYICDTAISELTITPPASGSIVVRFTAGSNCIVSLPQTVKLPAWFDISSLEAGTTYEIIITDGVYGGVMSWAA